MSHSIPRAVVYRLLCAACLLLIPGEVFSVDWQVRLSPRNSDYLELVIFADQPIHDVVCAVNLYDEDNDVIATRRFTVTDPNHRVVSGTVRKFLWHGMEGVRTAQGDFMDYKFISGAVYGPSPRSGGARAPMPPPRREFSNRIAPLDEWQPLD